MLINKIPASSKVELHCSVPGREPLVFNVDSVLGALSKDKSPLLYCTPVLVNEKLANLKSCSITAYILNRGDHRRYMFNNVTAHHVKNPRQEGSLLVLCSQDDAKPLNYRRAPRVPCTAPCTVHFGGTVSPIKCRMRDISSCGIAFIVHKDYTPIMGNTAKVSFTVDEVSMSYNLQAVVVRLQDVSDTEVLVGCDLTDYYPSLVALCNQTRAKAKK